MVIKKDKRKDKKGPLPKENRDNFQDMIYPYLTYEFKILTKKKDKFFIPKSFDI